LPMHAHRDAPNPGPRVQPGAQSPEGAVIRGQRAPGKTHSRTQELAALVEHALLLRKSRPPRSCGGFERYAVALALEELDRATRDALAVLPIAVIGTKLAIDRVIREDMVRRA
jgi:hypothetical protein